MFAPSGALFEDPYRDGISAGAPGGGGVCVLALRNRVGISRWVDLEARRGGVRELEVLREGREKKKRVRDVGSWSGPQRNL